MTDLIDRLNERTVRVLPKDWQKGLECPECGTAADRPKCVFEMGHACPRHDPGNYDPSPYQTVPDALCTEAATRIHDLEVMVARLYDILGTIDEYVNDPRNTSLDAKQFARLYAASRCNVLPGREFEALKEVVEKRCGLRG